MTEATANFPADFVLGRAIELIEKNEKERDEAVEAKLRELEATPVKQGFLFWQRDHYRTRAEAEADFALGSHYLGYLGSMKWQTTYKFEWRLERLEPLRRLAGAAMLHSQEATVTLTAGNCATLDIPLEAGE